MDEKILKKGIAWILVAGLVFGVLPIPVSNVMAGEISVATVTDAEYEEETSEKMADGLLDITNQNEEEEVEPQQILEMSQEESEPEADTFDSQQTVDGVTVRVMADEGVFPEGSTLSVRRVQESEAENAGILSEVNRLRGNDTNVTSNMIFDITVYAADGTEIQPDTSAGNIKVSFTTPEISEDTSVSDVYHINTDNGAVDADKLEVISETGDTVVVVTDGFSYYMLGLTSEGEGEETVPENHVHDGVSFTAWEAADSLPAEAGNYYLTQDVTLASWSPQAKIGLCLNGHTVTFTGDGLSINSSQVVLDIYSSEDGGVINNGSKSVKVSGGTLNLHSGTIICGNEGIYIQGSATFNMSGGKLVSNGNYAIYTSYVNGKGSLNLSGGTIECGNSCIEAIYSNFKEFNMSGSPTFIYSGTSATYNDIYFPYGGANVNVGTLSNSTKIKVGFQNKNSSMNLNSRTFTTGYSTNNSGTDPEKYFTCTMDGFWIVESNGELQMTKNPVILHPTLATTSEDGKFEYGTAPTFNLSGYTGDGEMTYKYKIKGDDDSTYSTVVPKNVGQYTALLDIAPTPRVHAYDPVCDFSITKAPLTVRPQNKTIYYGDPLPAGEIVGDGFKYDDTTDNLEGAPGFTYESATGESYNIESPADTYTISVSGVTSDNYDITFETGTLTVIKPGKSRVFIPVKGDDTAAFKLLSTNEEMLNAILTDADETSYINGADAITTMTIDCATLSSNEVTAIKNVFGSEAEVGLCFDTKTYKQIGSNPKTQVGTLDSSAAFSIDVPSDLLIDDISTERDYKVVRISNGVATDITTGYDETTNVASAATAQFAKIALVYIDKNIDKPDPDSIEHIHNKITFKPWRSTDSLPSEAGSYYLTNDVELGGWYLGKDVNLCLNGYSITITSNYIQIKNGATLSIFACEGGRINSAQSVRLNAGGTLNLYGGTISRGGEAVTVNGVFNMSGGTVSNGTVVVESAGVFNMSKGTITGIDNPIGNGVVNIKSGGSFNLSGGSISGNKINKGAIEYSSGTFRLSGNPTFSNNTTYGNTYSDIFILNNTNNKISVGKLTNTIPISVGFQNQTGVSGGTIPSFVITSGYKANNGDDLPENHFVSKLVGYRIDQNTDGEVILTCVKDPISPTVSVAECIYGETPDVTIEGNPGNGTPKIEYKESTAEDSAYSETPPTKAGSYKVRVTIPETVKYRSGTAEQTFEIKKAKLTVTPSDQSIGYSEMPSDDNVTLSYEGFKYDDTADSVTGTPVYTYTDSESHEGGNEYTADSASGKYYIHVSGLSSENYEMGYTAGILSVLPLGIQPIECVGYSSDAFNLVSPDTDVVNAVLDKNDDKRVSQGAAAKITINVETADPTDEEIVKIRQAAGNGAEVGVCYDVSVFKEITGQDKEAVRELETPIRFGLSIPDDMKNTDPKVNRVYKVVRLHRGTAEALSTETGTEGNSVVTESDKFSIYAITFTDDEVIVPEPEEIVPEPEEIVPAKDEDTVKPETPKEETTEEKKSDDSKPEEKSSAGSSQVKTGDGMNTAFPIYLLIMTIINICLLVALKWKYNNIQKKRNE